MSTHHFTQPYRPEYVSAFGNHTLEEHLPMIRSIATSYHSMDKDMQRAVLPPDGMSLDYYFGQYIGISQSTKLAVDTKASALTQNTIAMRLAGVAIRITSITMGRQ